MKVILYEIDLSNNMNIEENMLIMRNAGKARKVKKLDPNDQKPRVLELEDELGPKLQLNWFIVKFRSHEIIYITHTQHYQSHIHQPALMHISLSHSSSCIFFDTNLEASEVYSSSLG